jgi:haloacetate dehalogenase
MFEGFDLRYVEVADHVRVRTRVGGRGPAVVLLHGHPRTHTTWHRVAPLLAAAGHSVVCPDLRGYGGSTCPPPAADHRQASKREMARDIVRLMTHLNHERFAVVGHDRGSHVAFRLAMDHPHRVTHAALIDCIPIGEALARTDARFAQAWWHWFFFAQPRKPEQAILADPDAWYGAGPEVEVRMGAENYADWRTAIHEPTVITGMLEDYRAGLGPDRADDDADRAAGRQLTCPTLLIWSTRDDIEQLYGDPLAVWRPWATNTRGQAIDSGHHVAEEAPEALSSALVNFLAAAT